MNNESFQKVLNAVIGVLLVVLLVSAVLFHMQLVAGLDFDGENSVSESVNLIGLCSARHDAPVYRDISVPPHLLSPYTPLFYVIPGWVAKLLQTDLMGTVVVGRAYTYAGWIGIGLVIYALGRTMKCGWRVSLLTALLWWAGHLAEQMANSHRPDTLAIFFSLAAVWVYLKGDRPIHLAGAMALLVVAFLHKQTAVAVVPVILLSELEHRRVKRAVVAGAGWSVAVYGAVWLVNIMTNGALEKNVFGWLSMFARWLWPLKMLMLVMLFNAVIPGGLAACAALSREQCPAVLKRYFLLALLFAFLRTTNAGTSENHYLEPLALGCVLVAPLLQSWLTNVSGGRWMRVRLAWLGILLAFALLACWARVVSVPQWMDTVTHHQSVREQESAIWTELMLRVGQFGDPLLIEDPYLAFRSGPEPYIVDAGIFADMQQHGKFDDADLLRRVNDGSFAAIVTTVPLSDPERWRYFPWRWIKPMQQRYRLADSFEWKQRHVTYYIYRPAS